MTTSDNDNEALTAIRLANKGIKTWEIVIKAPPINVEGVQYDIIIRQQKDIQFLQKTSQHRLNQLRDSQSKYNLIEKEYVRIENELFHKNLELARFEGEIDSLKTIIISKTPLVHKLAYYYSLPWYLRWFAKKPS